MFTYTYGLHRSCGRSDVGSVGVHMQQDNGGDSEPTYRQLNIVP